MARQIIGDTRLAQRTSAAKVNANFTELYGRSQLIELDGLADSGSTFIPAGVRIDSISIRNKTANAVTGGIKIGTTAGATDVVAAQAVGANAVVTVTDANILKRLFSATAEQELFIGAVTAWNNAEVDISIIGQKVF